MKGTVIVTADGIDYDAETPVGDISSFTKGPPTVESVIKAMMTVADWLDIPHEEVRKECQRIAARDQLLADDRDQFLAQQRGEAEEAREMENNGESRESLSPEDMAFAYAYGKVAEFRKRQARIEDDKRRLEEKIAHYNKNRPEKCEPYNLAWRF